MNPCLSLCLEGEWAVSDIDIQHSAVNCKNATIIREMARNITYFAIKVKETDKLNTKNMWGIPVSLLVKPKLIFGTYEGHTVNIAQFCQFPKGKERTNFGVLKKKGAQARHGAIPS